MKSVIYFKILQHRYYICDSMNVLAVSCLNQELIWGMGSDFNQKGQMPEAGVTSILPFQSESTLEVLLMSKMNVRNEFSFMRSVLF